MPSLSSLARRAVRLVDRATGGRAKRIALAFSERVIGRHALFGTVPGLETARYCLNMPGLLGPYVVARGTLPVAGWALDLAHGAALPWRMRLGSGTAVATPVERADLATALSRIATFPTCCGGEAELPARLGPALLRIDVEARPGDWRCVFRAVVVGVGSGGSPDPGTAWRTANSRAREQAIADGGAEEQRRSADLVGRRPNVGVLVLGDDREARAATLRSLEAQTYDAYTTTLVGADDGMRDLASALATAEDDFVLPLRAGDRLERSALYELASAARASPDADLLYANEESDGASSLLPYFKPGWSPDTLEVFDYLGAPALYRTEIARMLPAETLYDLALRFTERTDRVLHLPRILCRRARAATEPWDMISDAHALAGRFQRTGRASEVEPVVPDRPCYRRRLAAASSSPLVSIVIPTAGRDLTVDGRSIDLVVDCVRGIRERSTYPNLEIIVVGNPDLPARKAEVLTRLGCRLTVFEEPIFNVAKKLNLGGALAQGEYVLLLNDDVEVVAPDWIDRMVAQAAKPHVGAVGGKLLYPDRTLQHVGVALFRGNPDHVRRHYPADDLGYVFSTCGARNYMAVTGACMMSRLSVFRQVGGYTEALSVSFNDVDYCLKIGALGLHTVYEPGCELIHYESASRIPTLDPAEYDYFTRTWGAAIASDPFYDNAAFGTAPPRFEPFIRPATTP